ncbi:MAG TPA: response regulator, partial [Humisphaera sp.]
ATYLRRRGYPVTMANSVVKGRSLLDAGPTHLILDLRLPDGSGLELLKRAQQRTPPVKVAVVTAYDRAEVSAEAVMLRPDAFLTKPIEFEDVLAWVEGARAAAGVYLDEGHLRPGSHR